jgi:hypothetical protein
MKIPAQLPPVRLPTEYEVPTQRIEDQCIILYGPPGIGKSTFFSDAPDHLFLSTESGLRNLRRREVAVRNWLELLAVYQTLRQQVQAGQCPYRVIILDTADRAYTMAEDYLASAEGAEFVDDKDSANLNFGRGPVRAARIFHDTMQLFKNLRRTFSMVFHSDKRKLREEDEGYKLTPNVPDKVAHLLTALADLILYADYREIVGQDQKVHTQRMIRTVGSPRVVAKDRTERLPPLFEMRKKTGFRDFLALWEKGGAADEGPAEKPAELAPPPSQPPTATVGPVPNDDRLPHLPSASERAAVKLAPARPMAPPRTGPGTQGPPRTAEEAHARVQRAATGR